MNRGQFNHWYIDNTRFDVPYLANGSHKIESQTRRLEIIFLVRKLHYMSKSVRFLITELNCCLARFLYLQLDRYFGASKVHCSCLERHTESKVPPA